MTDSSQSPRSLMMAKVRSRDTAPELRVRKLAHALGRRFRLHRRDLPGTPDLVFPRFKLAIFVHGCFWHRHPGCVRASMPLINVEFWKVKFQRNCIRDTRALDALTNLGWRVAVIWECETRSEPRLREILSTILEARQTQSLKTQSPSGPSDNKRRSRQTKLDKS